MLPWRGLDPVSDVIPGETGYASGFSDIFAPGFAKWRFRSETLGAEARNLP